MTPTQKTGILLNLTNLIQKAKEIIKVAQGIGEQIQKERTDSENE